VRPHPVSESAPMLMAMAMFFLSKRPLRAYGCRAEGSHSLGGKEKQEAILGPVDGAGAAGLPPCASGAQHRPPGPLKGRPLWNRRQRYLIVTNTRKMP
jgi:hypothetical protein